MPNGLDLAAANQPADLLPPSCSSACRFALNRHEERAR
jgi:hypothetical protein